MLKNSSFLFQNRKKLKIERNGEKDLKHNDEGEKCETNEGEKEAKYETVKNNIEEEK